MAAATYMPAYKGYINDVPELWFKRNDGKTFHFDQLTDASVTPNVEYTEVNGGWSLYPVAYLPAASTMEMSFTSAQFSAELFAMANNRDFTTESTTVQNSISVAPHSFTKTVPNAAESSAIYSYKHDQLFDTDKAPTELHLLGFDADGDTTATKTDDTITKVQTAPTSPLTENVFQWMVIEAKDTQGKPITGKSQVEIFISKPSDYGQTLEFYYEESKTVSVINIDNKQSAIGELIMKYPIYSNGDESKAASVKGYVIVDVYKCRATAMPGFDSSYKSGATNAVTFSTMKPDSNLHNGAVYSIKYYDI